MTINDPKPEIYRIEELVVKVKSGDIKLPKFQRPFVWKKENILEDICCKGWMSNPPNTAKVDLLIRSGIERFYRGGGIQLLWVGILPTHIFIGKQNRQRRNPGKSRPPLPPTTPEGGARTA